MVGVVDDDIHSRQADYLMQLVPALVDIPPLGHERTDFPSGFLDELGQLAPKLGHGIFRDIRNDFLGNEQDFLDAHFPFFSNYMMRQRYKKNSKYAQFGAE